MKRSWRKACIYDILKMPTQAISLQAQNSPGAALELQGTAHRQHVIQLAYECFANLCKMWPSTQRQLLNLESSLRRTAYSPFLSLAYGHLSISPRLLLVKCGFSR